LAFRVQKRRSVLSGAELWIVVWMKIPNALRPDRMTPEERRAELCRILASGLVRLRARDLDKSVAESGSTLHSPPDRSGHANPTRRRDA
tara:strand:- start:2416 stop:2682 length:267 start_codon:yes stop_codon:yes gene_type:complete